MPKRMKTADLIDEYLWLVGNGVSPVLACEQLHVKPMTMSRYLYRADYADLGSELTRDMNWPGRLSA